MTSLSATSSSIRLLELLGHRLSVLAVIHGPDEVFHKWITRIRDVVIQIWHQGTQVDLHCLIRMLRMVVELLSIYVDPGACPMAGLAL